MSNLEKAFWTAMGFLIAAVFFDMIVVFAHNGIPQ